MLLWTKQQHIEAHMKRHSVHLEFLEGAVKCVVVFLSSRDKKNISKDGWGVAYLANAPAHDAASGYRCRLCWGFSPPSGLGLLPAIDGSD